MSGHSHWATIKRKKGANDAKRGAAFTRLGREIAIAAREGADPDANYKLRLVMDKARAQGMPKDNIERAIRRGAGLDKDAAAFEEATFEGYGPHGVPFVVKVVTDNRNRTISDHAAPSPLGRQSGRKRLGGVAVRSAGLHLGSTRGSRRRQDF
jgi:YebC/PmpR family DNA-binding regulatory protein